MGLFYRRVRNDERPLEDRHPNACLGPEENHEFVARFDTVNIMDPTGKWVVEGRTVYVHDICTACGKVIRRGR